MERLRLHGVVATLDLVPHRRDLISLLIIALLLASFATLAYSAARTKSATADEPLHALGAYVRLFHGDFRLDPEDPPLFGYWAMIAHDGRTLKLDLESPAFKDVLSYMWRYWTWTTPTLYATEGNDPETFINRSRAMMTILGVALGAVIAWWAWDLAGRGAAVVACALYCFCPNFLGHAPLIKNDVPLALVMLSLLFAACRAGARLTWLNLIAMALLAAAALTTKFSGVLLAPMLAIVLLIRALMPRPWPVLGRLIVTRGRRLMWAMGALLVCTIVGVAGVWACYGFRYQPTKDATRRLNMPLIARAAARNKMLNANGGVDVPQQQEFFEAHPGVFVGTILFLDRRELLPQAWLAGLLDTYATTLRRKAFLVGDIRATGWWYYFPLAMLFKTPLATLLGGALALGAAWWARLSKLHLHQLDRWEVACFVVPIGIYAASAMTSNLNLGLRHVLPIYPFLFVLMGVVTARLRLPFPRATSAIAAILLVGLATETLLAWPNYIAFFNVAAGGSRGGLRLLGDSNLDWGQDLTLLRDWQRRHPDEKLYLSYFGGAWPNYYVDATPFSVNPPQPQPSETCVLAVSATELQGVYESDELRNFYRYLSEHPPREVLGGTIYLYDLPLR
jgi:4-amino-4-deoxy-L-arabinose transferase-like glycosyltransferase